VKPTPLSALLADDLLLDQVGARLDTDDDLGSLLLAVAHQADTPIPRAAPTRRRRPHRGLTVLAALGVAVSGATVAAAVELAPVPSDQASSTPHLRGGLPRSLQALVLPFLAGTPFQSHLVLPVGGRLADPFAPPFTAEGLLAADPSSVYPMGDPIVGVTTPEESQDPARGKTQGKGTPNGGTTLTDPSGSGTDADDQGGDTDDDQDGATGGDQPQPTESTPQPKPTKTPTPPPATTIPTPTITPIPTPVTTGPPNGQSTGHNGQGNGRGPGGSGGGSGTTGTGGTSTTGGTTTSGTLTDAVAERDDPASRVPPKGRNNVRVVSQPPATGVAPSLTTTGTTTGTTTSTTDTGTTPSSTATSPAAP
jgi:uncharacterized membrane protein YgcG